jgi:hypothetical protein
LKNIIGYITQPSKTEQRLISGKDCMPESALAEMETVKNMHGKNNGRQYIHIVQSFNPEDILSYEDANKIGVLLAERFTGFQAVVTTHKDREHIHNHILLNTVNFETGLKFQQSKKDMQAVKNSSDELCLAHGLSVIEKPSADTDIQKNEYHAAMKGESWKIALIVSIDKAMEVSKSKDEFIANMNRLGYGVSWTAARKNITYTTPDDKKCRDNKLHDIKYLKEEMDKGFREIEANTRAEESRAVGSATTTANDPGLPAYDSETKSADRPTSGGDRHPQKKSIKELLADAEVEVKRRDAEKRAMDWAGSGSHSRDRRKRTGVEHYMS